MNLHCSQPPKGRGKWTLQLLADTLVELEGVECISSETVRQTLKKSMLKPHLQKCWVIPPEHNADFVAHMEDILDLYRRPYNPQCPLINMDEKPIQLIQETRTPLPAKPGKPLRYEYEYERMGTASVFLFTEPLTGWRMIDAKPQRTAVDWAYEIKPLLDDHYLEAQKVLVVCDHLNTHPAQAPIPTISILIRY